MRVTGHHDENIEPVDPDVDLSVPARWRVQAPVIAVVAVGGGLGAAARYAASLMWPTDPGAFPWTTLGVNAAGCAIIGVFMVVISDVRAAPRLLRPFFGTGVLGGFTTFSTYAADVQGLLRDGHAATALAYLAGTVPAALAAVWCAAASTRHVIARKSGRAVKGGR